MALVGLLLATPGCKQGNPAFDEPTESGGSSSGLETSSVPTGNATTETTSGPPSTSSSTATEDGTSSNTGPATSSSSTSEGTSSSSSSTGMDTDGCEPGLMDCFGVCVDLQTDRDNCSECGMSCPGNQICVDADCGPDN